MRTVEQEEHVLGVGIVRIPAEEEELRVALAHLVLKPVEVGRPHHELHAQLAELLGQPVRARLVAEPARRGVEIQDQRLAGLRVAPLRPARLGEQAARDVHPASARLAVVPFVDHRVDAGLALARAEHPRRDRAHRRHAAAVEEDGDELLHVQRHRHRLAQLARALPPFPGVPAPHHRIEHVEAEVEDRRRHGRQQADAARLHLVGQADFAGAGHRHRLVEVVRRHARGIVVALQELVPVRDALPLAREDDLVDEGHGLAAVGQQASLSVRRLALAGVGIRAVIRVAHQHHARVGVVFHQHVRPGADRPPVQRQVALGHARLAEEAVGLRRHRPEERHRQPEQELRVGTLQRDAIRVAIDHLDTRQLEPGEIDPPRVSLRLVGQPHLQLLQARQVFGHQLEDRRMQPRVRQALDLMHEIGSFQLTRAGLGKIAQPADLAQILGRHRQVARRAVIGTGKRRMRLVHHARADADLVDALRHPRRIGRVRQQAAGGIVAAQPRHLGGDARLQRVRPLQIVVLQRRLDDLVQEGRLVLAVGLHRIEMLGALGEGGVQDVLTALARRIGVVPYRPASAQQQQAGACERAESGSEQDGAAQGRETDRQQAHQGTDGFAAEQVGKRGFCQVSPVPA